MKLNIIILVHKSDNRSIKYQTKLDMLDISILQIDLHH